MSSCQHCGAPEDGAYCRRCGQKQATDRFTLRSVLTSALAEIVDLEQGVTATLYGLLRRPGTVVRDYWRRCTKPYVNPVRYFLFAVAALQLSLWQTGAAQNMVRGVLAGAQEGDDLGAVTSQAQALEVFGDYFVLFFIAGLVILAAVSWIASPQNLAEELIFHLFVWGHVALGWSLLNVLGHALAMPPGVQRGYALGTLGATVSYYVWADVAAHRPDTDRSLVRAAAEALGTLVLFVITYSALAGFVVGFVTSALA
jgi:hypothetical protein